MPVNWKGKMKNIKIKGDRKLILFAHKLKYQRENRQEMLAKRGHIFVRPVCRSVYA